MLQEISEWLTLYWNGVISVDTYYAAVDAVVAVDKARRTG